MVAVAVVFSLTELFIVYFLRLPSWMVFGLTWLTNTKLLKRSLTLSLNNSTNQSRNLILNNDMKLTSSVNELKQNQIQTEKMSKRLYINISQFKSHVQELSNNMSDRVASLVKGYTQMNDLIKHFKQFMVHRMLRIKTFSLYKIV